MNAESDRSAALQQGTREFAGVYERNAYLVYNLALRTTVDRTAAMDAACAAFLACLASEDPDAVLVKLTVRRALPGARQKPTVEAAGDAEAQAMLRATASLPAPERAALALVGLADADAAQVAAALEATEDASANLIKRAWTSFAEAARLPTGQAEKTYRGWLWAEPPTELWERLYPSFYAQLLRRLKAAGADGDASATAVVATVAAAAPKPSRRERRRARRGEKDARRAKPPGALRRGVRAMPIGRLVLLLVIAGAGAGAAYGTGLVGAKHRSGIPASSFGAMQSTQKLTPAQIAALRAQEAQASANYAAQQRLARTQAGQQAALRQAALKQLKAQQAAQRTAAKRRSAAFRKAQLAAQKRALQQATALAQPPPPQQSPRPSYQAPPKQSSSSNSSSSSGSAGGSKPGSGSQPSGSNPNPTSTQAQQQCLYNANDGTYVCPQQ